MSNFAKSLIKKHAERFDQGKNQLDVKRQEWDALVERSTKIFESVKSEAENHWFFDGISILDSRKTPGREEKLPVIQFSLGHNPVGYFQAFNSDYLALERDCGLTIGLFLNGKVACTYYPFSSELHSRKEKHLTAKVASSPIALTKTEIEKLFENLFSYAQVSSIYGSPQFTDHIRVLCLRVKHWWLHFQIEKSAIKLLEKVTGAAVDHTGES